jgi:hypothetical protein
MALMLRLFTAPPSDGLTLTKAGVLYLILMIRNMLPLAYGIWRMAYSDDDDHQVAPAA